MRYARVAVLAFVTCAIAVSMACAADREPTGIEYSPRLALAKLNEDVQFGTTNDDVAYGIAADKLGVAVVGTTTGTLNGPSNAGGRDAFVRLFDKRGAVVWTRQFGTTADDGAFSVAMDKNGIYVAGSTSGSLGPSHLGASDGYVQMFDANGNVVWITRLASAGADSAFGLAVDRDAVYVTGELRGNINGTTGSNADGYVAKLDARTGQILWMTLLAGASGGDDGARAVVVDRDAVFVAATYFDGALGTGPGAEDAYMATLDANTGAIVWLSTVATSGKDVGWDVTQNGKTVFLVGTLGTNSFAAAFNPLTGAMQWQTLLSTAGTDIASTTDADNATLLVGGFTTDAFAGASNAGFTDVFHARLDATTGAIQSVNQFGTAGPDAPYGSFLDGKAWYVVGTTGGDLVRTSGGGLDAWLLQLGAR